MPPKKKRADDEVDIDEALLRNYRKACKTLEIDPNKELLAVLDPEEERDGPMQQICTDAELGPTGMRAFAAALLARAAGMVHAPYTPLKSLRFWRNKAGDAGVAAIAQILKSGGDALALTHLEFMDNQVGPEGCWAIAESLMLGANTSLLTLRLDINPTLGDDGVIELCKGLRVNRTLTKLCLSYCEIGEEGARALASAMSSNLCAIKSLDLMGNKIGSRGLYYLATALQCNSKCEELILCDNEIGAELEMSVTVEALEALGQACIATTSALAKVDLEMNSIDPDHAQVLIPFLTPDNKKVTAFKVDASLPADIYDQLLRVDTGKKKGKKGKKGGKKKKK